MLKSCSKCGKIHDYNFNCNKRLYISKGEARQRSQYKWTKKSKEIRERANYLCEVCRDNGVYAYEGLEIHHIISVKENKDKLLDNYNLICLCGEHHREAEQGKIDNKYLFELARKREDNI